MTHTPKAIQSNDIDIVYTWVDGSDPAWLNKKDFHAQSQANPHFPSSRSNSRFRSIDELKYSLRSIEAYAPWVRKIHIITDAQTPKWLNTEHPKLQIVDHKDIFKNTNHLPCFNSTAIVSNIHNTPDLSEKFIYLNDDVFLGRPTSPNEFFPNGNLPFVFTKSIFPKKKKWHFLGGTPEGRDEMHFSHIFNSRLAVLNKTGVKVHYDLRHLSLPMKKSILQAMDATIYSDNFASTRSSRFREVGNTAIGYLFSFHVIATKEGKPKHVASPKSSASIKSLVQKALKIPQGEFITIGGADFEKKLMRIKAFRPMQFCINDDQSARASDQEKLVRFLEDYFPNPSSFEKKPSVDAVVRQSRVN